MRGDAAPDWGFIFAMLGHFYHMSREQVLSLTPRQVTAYLDNVPSCSEWSETFGKPRSRPQSRKQIANEAANVGMKSPKG